MEISYRREMKHNYMILEGENREDSYEVRMLSDNRIDGLMKFWVKRVDARCCYCYEITSRQPLGRILESKSLEEEELRTFIITMARTINKMEEYLLKEEQILLDPEYIYVEPELFSVEFCLVPGRAGDFPGDLRRLLEYLLGKVDYQNKQCVVMAYGLYRESLKENYGMEDLLRHLPEKEKERDTEIKEEAPELFVQAERAGTGKGQIEKGQIEKGNNRKHGIEKGKKEKSSWKERLKKLFGFRKHIDTEKRNQPAGRSEAVELPWQMVFAEGEGEEEGWLDKVPCNQAYAAGLNDKTPVSGVKDPADGQFAENSVQKGTDTFQTTLLFEKKAPPCRKLVSLEEGLCDICIPYFPFLIGKQEGLADYVLPRSTVSRLHVRIDEEDGNYRITDLNSTNGTSVAGKMLENNESVQVNTGDEVIVAGLRFRFA